VVAPGYASGATTLPVMSTLGVRAGDILIAAKLNASQCEVFSVTADPTLDDQIDRADNAGWNNHLFPASTYGFGDLLINMGTVSSHTYSVSASNALQLARFDATSPASTVSPQDLFPDIVILQALYGKDTNGDGVVDTYDQVTPTTNAGWRQLRAIRLVVVARSGQYEKEVVTSADPLWDVGSSATIDPTLSPVACNGGSQCLPLRTHITGGTDWQHYRYKVFDTVVPIMNLLWNS